MLSRRLLILAGLLSVSAPVVFSEARCPGSDSSLPLRLVQGTLFVLPVEVDGTGPYDFLLDTGAQVNSIDEKLALSLHLAPEGAVGVKGPGTYSRNALLRIDLSIGSHSVHHSPTVTLDSAQLLAFDPRVRGILGESFLEHFDFLIDNSRRILCLDESGTLSGLIQGKRVAIANPPSDPRSGFQFPRRIIVSAELADSTKPLFLTLDSGTNCPFLFVMRPRLEPAISGSRQILRRFVNGVEQDFALLQPLDLRIDHTYVRKVSFAVMLNRVGGSGTDLSTDGAVPTFAFRRIFVSLSKGYVILDSWN